MSKGARRKAFICGCRKRKGVVLNVQQKKKTSWAMGEEQNVQRCASLRELGARKVSETKLHRQQLGCPSATLTKRNDEGLIIASG